MGTMMLGPGIGYYESGIRRGLPTEDESLSYACIYMPVIDPYFYPVFVAHW
jgi:hypothetical protein